MGITISISHFTVTSLIDMDILNQNFQEKLPLVLEAIQESFHRQSSGGFQSLSSSPGLHKSSGQYRFNTVQQTYTNYVGSASSFLIVQIGICTFHWSSTAKRYFAKPFNFYVFPRGSRGRSLNRNFLVQSTAFDFLAGVGFDFNKWVYSGIPYLTFQEEDQFKKESLEKLENNMATIPIDPKDVEFVKTFRDKIDEWLLLPKHKTHIGIDIEASNSYRKRLIHQEVRNNYPDLKTIGKQYSVNVSRTSDKQREERRLAMQQKFDEEIDIAVGFRKVIDAISASKKTIVGHNFFLDLLHLYYQFMAPLPPKIEDFKKVVHNHFPSVIDTKYLATSCSALSVSFR
ncbi:hypothetical protein INT43_003306 [Umbelopsis isabellina]|uniref:Uncharacterized protein n=1 Tax=Mortierella isabellina TaxID=91625 RepID=A0A8H7PQ08_MORIS|nr:hypothetical protein INT43_003306 [Umbelopsis isabellina]